MIKNSSMIYSLPLSCRFFIKWKEAWKPYHISCRTRCGPKSLFCFFFKFYLLPRGLFHVRPESAWSPYHQCWANFGESLRDDLRPLKFCSWLKSFLKYLLRSAGLPWALFVFWPVLAKIEASVSSSFFITKRSAGSVSTGEAGGWPVWRCPKDGWAVNPHLQTQCV